MEHNRQEGTLELLAPHRQRGTPRSIQARKGTGKAMGSRQSKQSLARRDSDGTSGGRSTGDADTTEAGDVGGKQLSTHQRPEKTRTETQDTGRQTMEHTRTTRTIEIPDFDVDWEGTYVRNIEGKLSFDHARVLNGLTEKLKDSDTKLEDGQKVRKAIHAVRWILEQLK